MSSALPELPTGKGCMTDVFHHPPASRRVDSSDVGIIVVLAEKRVSSNPLQVGADKGVFWEHSYGGLYSSRGIRWQT
jgi:hypothetical protein